MPKTRTTLTIDEGVLRAVKVRAARTGRGDSEVIEEAVRAHLGIDLLDRLWARNDMDEQHAVEELLGCSAEGATSATTRPARRRPCCRLIPVAITSPPLPPPPRR